MGRYTTVDKVLNAVALEVGLEEDPFPYASQNAVFAQLRGLLNSAGQELVELHDWQILQKSHAITTAPGDTGDYPLPDDFSHMIDQTGWERSNHVPLGGPLSPQTWTYLIGRDLVSSTIYASFRLLDGKFTVFPSPPPPGLDINFEYVSRNWLQDPTAPYDRFDETKTGQDVILYEPILIRKYLKAKFLESKGFDATAARNEFETIFYSRSGKDSGAPILSAARRYDFPYLNAYRNTGDTGYGLP